MIAFLLTCVTLSGCVSDKLARVSSVSYDDQDPDFSLDLMNVGVLGDYVIYAGSESDYDVADKLYSIHAEDVAMEMSYDELEVWWQPTVIYEPLYHVGDEQVVEFNGKLYFSAASGLAEQ